MIPKSEYKLFSKQPSNVSVLMQRRYFLLISQFKWVCRRHVLHMAPGSHHPGALLSFWALEFSIVPPASTQGKGRKRRWSIIQKLLGYQAWKDAHHFRPYSNDQNSVTQPLCGLASWSGRKRNRIWWTRGSLCPMTRANPKLGKLLEK